MNTSEIRSFGEELRAFRERKRISQFQLAQALGVNRQTIGAWELGKNPPKDRTRVLELARILGLDDGETNILLATAFLDPLPPWHVPYHRNPLFTGREEVLQELHRVLVPGTAAAVTQSQAISGLGGVGKTQTALEYAYRYRDDYSAVLWLQADSFSLACVQIAEELGLPEWNEADQARIVAAIKRWLKSKTKWLLVLDNVEDLPMIDGFLPPGHHGCVLLTTRAQEVPEYIAHVHELEILPEEEGVLLLLRRAGLLARDAPLEQAASADCAQAKELWKLVEGLPLALDQIGAYIRATGCSLAHYHALYVDQQRRLDLLKLRGKIPRGHPESVVTTFSVAFEKIQAINPAGAEMLQVCALLHPKAIPEEIFTKGGDQLGSQLSSLSADPLLLDQAVNALQTYSFVRHDAQESTFSIHRLVQAVLQDSMPASDQEVWTGRVISAVNSVFPDVEHTTWSQCERLIPHVLACATRTQSPKSSSLDLAALLLKTAQYLRDRGQYIEAEPLFQRALHIREQALGPDHPEVALSLNNLANLYREQGKYAEAEPLYQRALYISEQALGPDHPEVAPSLNNLANFYREQGKYAEAEPLFQRALHIWEQALGPDHPQTAYPLNNLANLYQEQGKYTEAEPLYQRALHIWEQALGPDHPQTAYPLNGLAVLYSSQDKYAEAEPLFQRALHIWEQALGPEHSQVAYPLNNLANLYQEQGKYAESQPLFQRALHIWEQALGPDHPQIARALNNLAWLYRGQGKYTEAEPLYQRALHIWEQALAPHHPEVAYPLNGLAEVYREQGKYTEAEPLYQRALHIWEQALGPDHPQVAYSLNNLAILYQEQGKYTEAEPLFQRALHIWEQALGPDHPQVAYSLNGLAVLYSSQDKYAEAESLFQRALRIWEQVPGPEHPRVAYPLNGLANLYSSQSKYTEAEPLYQRALQIREHHLGSQHPETAEALHDFAAFRHTQGNRDKAKSLYEEALAIRAQTLGEEHPKTMETRERYVTLLREMGRQGEIAFLETRHFERTKIEEEREE